MINRSKFRGYDIEDLGGKWFFIESGESVKETYYGLPCGHCGKKDTKEGHDGCLGVLPGVMNACCGHGQIEEAYVQFLDGTIIDGDFAKIIMAELKKIN